MSSFERYSEYYDLLYRDKDYRAEAAFVTRVLEARSGAAGERTVLDLGCGTGRHDRLLAEHGYRVHGIDVSAAMIAQARAELASAAPGVATRVQFTEGDICRVRTGETFGAVVSLFHVMSYLPTQRHLEDALGTARAHLDAGGLLLFDAWYGPAVLTTPPSVRVKRASGPGFSVLRIAEPTLFANENRVDVKYTLLVSPRAGVVGETFEEVHRMRYWFHPEIEGAASRTGFEVVEFGEWMTGRTPDATTWNVYWVLRAVRGAG
jgi:SAM-dependent methyltransferase